jgi:small subunit ribosomal protein S18
MGMEDRTESFSRSRSASELNKKKRPKKKTNFRKKRPPLSLEFTYKDLSKLAPFLTDEGKIVGARVSGLRAFQQRQLTLAVKRARHIGFVSPTHRDFIH